MDNLHFREVHAEHSFHSQYYRNYGFGVGEGVVMVHEVVAAGGCDYMKLMAWKP